MQMRDSFVNESVIMLSQSLSHRHRAVWKKIADNLREEFDKKTY